MIIGNMLRIVTVATGGMPNKRFHSTKRLVWNYFRGIATYMNDEQAFDKVYDEWLTKFELKGVSEPKESINIIMSYVLGSEKAGGDHLKNRTLSDEQLQLLNRLCECRLARVPVQYIIGEWQFRNLYLSLAPPVFIPRPETETLVDLVLNRVCQDSGSVEIFEMGCGSGAISLSLAHESDKVVCTAIDQSELACRIAKKNASACNLDNRVKIIWAKLNKDGKIVKGVKENEDNEDLLKEYDIIVSNPPYVRHNDIFHLQPEILLYEDLRALNGGEDGLDIVKPLLKFAAKALKSKERSNIGGALLIEVDPSQPCLLEKWLLTQGKSLPLTLQKVHQDLFGKDRFIEFVKN